MMFLAEDDGTTLISTTNADAIVLINSHGEIRGGVTVTSNTKGIGLSAGSSINIEQGATVSGTQNGGSVVGTMHSTIEIQHGSTVSSVLCSNDNTTTVALMSSGSNYSSATIGNNCKTFRN